MLSRDVLVTCRVVKGNIIIITVIIIIIIIIIILNYVEMFL